jgi:Rrf2 family iron-sulfur cluster assembly transcriptional regulator
MQLSRAAQFALRTVLDLAVEGPTHTADVAARRGIPPAQAGKIIHLLSRAGIVRTSRGARGGVRLARAPEAVTIRDVIDAIEGPLTVARCLVWDDCPCAQPCPVRTTLLRLQHEMERLLDGVTVADLSTEGRRPERAAEVAPLLTTIRREG